MEPSKILVVNVTRIGDTLLTTPVLRALAAAWPSAEITFAGHPNRIEVMRNLPFVHVVRPISKNLGFLKGRIGGDRYDLALCYGSDAELVEYCLRVSSRVVAFRQESSALNRRLSAIGGEDGFEPTHAITWLMRLMRPLNVRPAGFHLSYAVSSQEAIWATRQAELLNPTGGPLIGLQVASFPTKAFRDWPIGHFKALCERILSVWPHARFVVYGGKQDARRASEIHDRFPERAVTLAGKLTLRQTAAIMQRTDLYIGVDTGPTHIMGALHKPMVSMYHPTSPARALAPLEHPCCHAIDHPLADSPLATPETPMAEISVDLVWQHVQDAIAGRNLPAPMTTRWQ